MSFSFGGVSSGFQLVIIVKSHTREDTKNTHVYVYKRVFTIVLYERSDIKQPKINIIPVTRYNCIYLDGVEKFIDVL